MLPAGMVNHVATNRATITATATSVNVVARFIRGGSRRSTPAASWHASALIKEPPRRCKRPGAWRRVSRPVASASWPFVKGRCWRF